MLHGLAEHLKLGAGSWKLGADYNGPTFMPNPVRRPRARDRIGAQGVVNIIREWIERGTLKRGDQLAPERELALQIGVSRPTVRAGLRSLVTMGVLESRQGMGTFITDRPPALGTESLALLASLHGFTHNDMVVARRVLQVGATALAAEFATPGGLAVLSEEVTGMFASLDDRQQFMQHHQRFHQSVGAASENPVLAALLDMVSGLVSERDDQASERIRDLKEVAQMHLRMYQAIRARDASAAAALMKEHLLLTERARAPEVRRELPPIASPATRPRRRRDAKA